MVARTERSPGFGSSTRLPGFPVALLSGGLAGLGQIPLQWRGRAGFAPASEWPRSCFFNYSAALVYRLDCSAARAASSSCFSRARSVR